MIPDNAFLRRLPQVLDRTVAVKLEALVFSADVIEASLGIIRRTTGAYGKAICGAPRRVHIELFTHAWAIVDCVHVTRQVLASLDYQTALATAFRDKYECALKLRNKMDHLVQNARNVGNSKGSPPIFGALGYICVENENRLGNEPLGGGIVMISAGTFSGDQKITLVNPAGIKMQGPVGSFRLEAFDEFIDLESVEEDLRTLMIEVNERVEERVTKSAEDLSKQHGISTETLLANSPGGLSLYLAFDTNNGTARLLSLGTIKYQQTIVVSGHAGSAALRPLSPPYGLSPPLPRLHPLPGEHRRRRKQPLATGARSLVVVEELEGAFAQLEDGDVRRRAGVERASDRERYA